MRSLGYKLPSQAPARKSTQPRSLYPEVDKLTVAWMAQSLEAVLTPMLNGDRTPDDSAQVHLRPEPKTRALTIHRNEPGYSNERKLKQASDGQLDASDPATLAAIAALAAQVLAVSHIETSDPEAAQVLDEIAAQHAAAQHGRIYPEFDEAAIARAVNAVAEHIVATEYVPSAAATKGVKAKDKAKASNEKERGRIGTMIGAGSASAVIGISSGLNTLVACLVFGLAAPWAVVIGFAGVIPNITLNYKPSVSVIQRLLNRTLFKGLTTGQGIAMGVGGVFVMATSLAVGALAAKTAVTFLTVKIAALGLATVSMGPGVIVFAAVLGLSSVVCTFGLLLQTISNLLRYEDVYEPVYENGRLKRNAQGKVIKQKLLDEHGNVVRRNGLSKFMPWVRQLFTISMSRQSIYERRHNPLVRRFYQIQEVGSEIRIRIPRNIRIVPNPEMRKSVARQVMEKFFIVLMIGVGAGITLFATIGTLGTWQVSFSGILTSLLHAGEATAALWSNIIVNVMAGAMRFMLVGRRVLSLSMTAGQAIAKGLVNSVSGVAYIVRLIAWRFQSAWRLSHGQKAKVRPVFAHPKRERSAYTSALQAIRDNFAHNEVDPKTQKIHRVWTIRRGLVYAASQFFSMLMVLVNAIGNALLNSQHLDAVHQVAPGFSDTTAQVVTAAAAGGTSAGLTMVSTANFVDDAFEWGKHNSEQKTLEQHRVQAEHVQARAQARVLRNQAYRAQQAHKAALLTSHGLQRRLGLFAKQSVSLAGVASIASHTESERVKTFVDLPQGLDLSVAPIGTFDEAELAEYGSQPSVPSDDRHGVAKVDRDYDVDVANDNAPVTLGPTGGPVDMDAPGADQFEAAMTRKGGPALQPGAGGAHTAQVVL